jgi:hypothetical protein
MSFEIADRRLACAAKIVANEAAEAEIRNLNMDSIVELRSILAAEGIEELAFIRANVRLEIERTMDLEPRTSSTQLCVGNGVFQLGNGEILPWYKTPPMFVNTMEVREPYPRSGWDVLAFSHLEIQQRNYDRRGPRGV